MRRRRGAGSPGPVWGPRAAAAEATPATPAGKRTAMAEAAPAPVRVTRQSGGSLGPWGVPGKAGRPPAAATHGRHRPRRLSPWAPPAAGDREGRTEWLRWEDAARNAEGERSSGPPWPPGVRPRRCRAAAERGPPRDSCRNGAARSGLELSSVSHSRDCHQTSGRRVQAPRGPSDSLAGGWMTRAGLASLCYGRPAVTGRSLPSSRYGRTWKYPWDLPPRRTPRRPQGTAILEGREPTGPLRCEGTGKNRVEKARQKNALSTLGPVLHFCF